MISEPPHSDNLTHFLKTVLEKLDRVFTLATSHVSLTICPWSLICEMRIMFIM